MPDKSEKGGKMPPPMKSSGKSSGKGMKPKSMEDKYGNLPIR
jgi:hypothetical protein